MNKLERVKHIEDLLKNVRREYSEVEIGCAATMRTAKAEIRTCIGCSIDSAIWELRKLQQELEALTEPLFND